MPALRVFFGHDYFSGNKRRLRRYRALLRQGCADVVGSRGPRVELLFGDAPLGKPLLKEIRRVGGDIRSISERNDFWARIVGVIRTSDLAIFDLSRPGGRPVDVNWNVLLELGVAIGARRPVRVMARRRRVILQRLTNLAGAQVEECRAPKDVPDLVRQFILAFHHARPPARRRRS